ncbi:sugar phosphate isomerase/epimerase family protein [Burkholderia multivorans]|uniref:sugar phosphate isomerase/epimerase family protein n=1 Tax=Burkholderia multivorans TaxID=87883 RepID=UPI0021C1A461|nr:sugar phosphate isomerase/epimerase [Burkholderia multivorans]
MIDHMVMYNANVRSLPFAEQCRAAALAGCNELTISPADYRKHRAAGLTPQVMKQMAEDNAVVITHLDPFVQWTPIWIPTDEHGAVDLSFIDFDEEQFFRIMDELGCRSLTAVGTFPKGTYPVSQVTDLFGALCQRAAQRGFRVDLEFIPFLGVDTLANAWDIVGGANAQNSGIMFDMWHHRRSDSSDAFLATIPGRWITGVQVNDGDAVIPEGVTLLEDCMMRRLVPGEGAFRVRDTLAVLKKTGGLNNVGPEVFSATFDALPADEIASRCRESMAAMLA